MTHTNHPAPHATMANEDRARRPALGTVRPARIQLVSDGVVASYIHDISVRNGPRRPVAGRGRPERSAA